MRCGKPHDLTHLRGRTARHPSCAAHRANRPDTFEIERKESEIREGVASLDRRQVCLRFAGGLAAGFAAGFA
ncbi:TPA: hypothetical protein ACK3Q6_008085, partial [Burkholderia cepacia]